MVIEIKFFKLFCKKVLTFHPMGDIINTRGRGTKPKKERGKKNDSVLRA
jgi:hypothetical protein